MSNEYFDSQFSLNEKGMKEKSEVYLKKKLASLLSAHLKNNQFFSVSFTCEVYLHMLEDIIDALITKIIEDD